MREQTREVINAHVCACGHSWGSHTWTGSCRFETCRCGCIDPVGPPVKGCGCHACFVAHEQVTVAGSNPKAIS